MSKWNYFNYISNWAKANDSSSNSRCCHHSPFSLSLSQLSVFKLSFSSSLRLPTHTDTHTHTQLAMALLNLNTSTFVSQLQMFLPSSLRFSLPLCLLSFCVPCMLISCSAPGSRLWIQFLSSCNCNWLLLLLNYLSTFIIITHTPGGSTTNLLHDGQRET